MKRRKIECVECGGLINAELVSGDVIYPHRPDLGHLFFWRCPQCDNYVGCHRNSRHNDPLGVIPNAELRQMRNRIHKEMDYLWQSGQVSRAFIYNRLSRVVGHPYHNGELTDFKEAYMVLEEIGKIKDELRKKGK